MRASHPGMHTLAHTHTAVIFTWPRLPSRGRGGRDVGGLSAVTWSSEKRRWWWWRGGGGLWICSARAKQLRRPESGARACECVSVCVVVVVAVASGSDIALPVLVTLIAQPEVRASQPAERASERCEPVSDLF